jgi:hypothetical protein
MKDVAMKDVAMKGVAIKDVLRSSLRLACTLAIIGTAAALGAADASAYTLLYCGSTPIKWGTIPLRMRASGVGFPAGPWRDALSTVINTRWYNNPSNFYFSLTYDEPGVSLSNGENEIWWENGSAAGSSVAGFPAINYSRWNCSDARFTEADVIFNNQVAYTPYMTTSSLWEYGGSSRPFQTTAMHEFGHSAGLAHTNWTYNIMGIDWTHIHSNGGTSFAYPGEDASRGVAALYGGLTGFQDIGVVHWKYLGASGEYSSHERTRLYNGTGSLLASYVDAGEPRYYVNRGQTVQLELTGENNGGSYQNIQIGYFVSTNNLITTADRRIGGTTFGLSPDLVYTYRATLTIPADLAPGNYWLGVIFDETGAIVETSEANNATYIPIRVL